MGLSIRKITFSRFRNYREFSLSDIGDLTVLVGPNAVGKTNIVEGVQLLTALSSFRHPTIDQMILDGESAAFLEADISDGARLLTVSLNVSEHAKKYSLNGKPKKTADLKGLMPAVTFTPDDLELVKGSMTLRRTAVDALGSQLSANHYLIKKDYEKVVRHKNKLLKEEASPDLLDSIDELLITCGAQLACYRIALLRKLVPACIERYEAISSGGERLAIRYYPSWGQYLSASDPVSAPISFGSDEGEGFALERDVARETLARALSSARCEELARRRALVGPHADRLEFFLNGKDATVFGSQGQQRSIVLAFKLAEAAVVEEVLNQKPLMLLDDVMSELDERRRESLVEFVVRDVQTFVTTANLQYFDKRLLDKARVVHLPHTEGGAA